MLMLIARLFAVIAGVVLVLVAVLELMTQSRGRQYCGPCREVW